MSNNKDQHKEQDHNDQHPHRQELTQHDQEAMRELADRGGDSHENHGDKEYVPEHAHGKQHSDKLTEDEKKQRSAQQLFSAHQADPKNPQSPVHQHLEPFWDEELDETRPRLDPNTHNKTGVNPNDTEAVIESNRRADHYFGEKGDTVDDTKHPLPKNAGNSQAEDDAEIDNGFSSHADKIH